MIISRNICPYTFMSAAAVMLEPSGRSLGVFTVIVVFILTFKKSEPLEMFAGGMAAFAIFTFLSAL